MTTVIELDVRAALMRWPRVVEDGDRDTCYAARARAAEVQESVARSQGPDARRESTRQDDGHAADRIDFWLKDAGRKARTTVLWVEGGGHDPRRGG